jgi:UDPglucose 6-dehydrogenase
VDDANDSRIVWKRFAWQNDTLRRSTAIEFCVSAADAGARVVACDPSVRVLPQEFAAKFALEANPIQACTSADALVICTEWPEFAVVDADAVIAALRHPIVIDPKRFLERTFRAKSTYFGIGVPN